MKRRWWKFAVIRGEGIPARLDGMWFEIPNDRGIALFDIGEEGFEFEATNRWEQRDDGEVAVVYEPVGL